MGLGKIIYLMCVLISSTDISEKEDELEGPRGPLQRACLSAPHNGQAFRALLLVVSCENRFTFYPFSSTFHV